MISFKCAGPNLAKLLATYVAQEPVELHFHEISSRMPMSDEGIVTRYNILSVTLADVLHALETHPAVLRDERANIFYIRDRNNNLQCLHAYLTPAGWHGDINTVQRNFRWRDGRLIFTR